MKPKTERSARSPLPPLLVFFAAFYLLTHPGPPHLGDENTFLLTAESMLSRGALHMEGKTGRPTLVVGRDGHAYTKLGIGQPLAIVPLLAAGKLTAPLFVSPYNRLGFRFFVASALPAGLAVCTLWLLYALAISFGYAPRTALALAAVLGVGTLAWPYAGSLLSEPLQMCTLLLCVYALCRWRRGASDAWLAVSAFGLGLAITAKIAVAVVLPLVLAYALYTMWEKQREDRAHRWPIRLALFVAPLALWLGVNLWYNWARFGQPFDLGYGQIERDVRFGFATPWTTGLYGLLFSSGKGLFLYAPVLVLCFFGVGRFWRAHRRECLLILGVAASLLLISARWHGWHGDYSWGPRYLLPIVPLLMLLTAPVWERAAGKPLHKIALLLLVLVSIGVQALGVFVDPKRYPHLIHYFTDVQSTYDAGAAQGGQSRMRDDLVLNHFVPELSPILAHAWMLKYGVLASIGGDTPELRRRFAAGAPWLSLNEGWRVRVDQGPGSVGEGFLSLNWWYLKWWHVMRRSRGLGVVLLVLSSAATAGSAVWLALRVRSADAGR